MRDTWRIQMVKTAKAFAEQPGIKENIKEFKVVSTGTDVAAQLGAMEDFINQGHDTGRVGGRRRGEADIGSPKAHAAGVGLARTTSSGKDAHPLYSMMYRPAPLQSVQ